MHLSTGRILAIITVFLPIITISQQTNDTVESTGEVINSPSILDAQSRTRKRNKKIKNNNPNRPVFEDKSGQADYGEDDLAYLKSLIRSNTTQLVVRPRQFTNTTDNKITEIPTVVRVRLLIETISKLSEVDMEMTVTFTLYQLWNDGRLLRESIR